MHDSCVTNLPGVRRNGYIENRKSPKFFAKKEEWLTCQQRNCHHHGVCQCAAQVECGNAMHGIISLSLEHLRYALSAKPKKSATKKLKNP